MRLPKIPTLALLLILVFTFFLRIPSLFEPNWYGDEGIFAAVAQGLLKDGTLYIDAWDNKPLLIYLLYTSIFEIFGVQQFWLRFFASISILLTAFLIFQIGRKTLGVKRALFATLIFGILASSPVLEGNLALTELFMILPQTLAFFLFVAFGQKEKLKRVGDFLLFFLIGILFSIGFLFKQVGGLEGVALGAFVLLTQKDFLKKGVLLFLGFFVPFFLSSLYFGLSGGILQFKEFFFASYTYYRIYLKESPIYGLWFNALKYLPFLASIFWLLTTKLQKKEVKEIQLFFLWFSASFLGALFSGRPYGHYLVAITPASSLILASLKKPKKISLLLLPFIFLIFPSIILIFSAFRTFINFSDPLRISYYKNFFSYILGKMDQENYNDSFDKNVNEISAISTFLKSQKIPQDEYVYIWGDFPWVYALSDLKNPTRFVTSFHVFGVPKGREEVIKNINQKKPRFIVKTNNAIGRFDRLDTILDINYEKTWEIGGSQIYERRRN